MYYYHFFGLQINSEILFPGFEEKNLGPADVSILFGSVDTSEYAMRPESVIPGRCHDLFQFLLKDGNTILIDISKETDDSFLFQIIQGELLSALLRQRGLLVLHACSVVKNGVSTSFVGDSGWGKSTLAEYYCQNGYSLLSDDVLVLDSASTPPVAYPGYPDIRLREEAGRYLRKDFENLKYVASERHRRISDHSDSLFHGPASMGIVFILRRQYSTETRAAEMSPINKIAELIRHTRSSNLVIEPNLLRDQLEQLSLFCQKVPVFLLSREKSLSSLPKILDISETYLEISPRFSS